MKICTEAFVMELGGNPTRIPKGIVVSDADERALARPDSWQAVEDAGVGTVTEVSSADTSIGVASGATAPLLTVAPLNVLLENAPPEDDLDLAGQQMKNAADGVDPTDLATVGQTLGTTGSQITVGAAGPAAALPATPTTYIKVTDQDGNHYVIPAYPIA